MRRDRREFGPATEFAEFDKERAAHHRAAGLFDEFDACLHGAARCEQVIDKQHTPASLHTVDVHLQLRRAVFEIVFEAVGAIRQLTGFTQRDERFFEPQRHGRREQKAARLGSGNRVKLDVFVMVRERLDGKIERGRVG